LEKIIEKWGKLVKIIAFLTNIGHHFWKNNNLPLFCYIFHLFGKFLDIFLGKTSAQCKSSKPIKTIQISLQTNPKKIPEKCSNKIY
jgi:hypothetical protein